ncbi:hypothetical protein JCM3775_000252 [Rhodotorula graminis]
MASSSPPPPPDPNRLNPFNSGCNASTPSRPALRRSKTLANPESPTRWTREPLADVTNAVLGREGTASRRLQRIDPELLLPIPAFSPTNAARRREPSAENTPSSPSPSQSRIPRSTALRRTRSAAPTFRSGEPSSPSTGAYARHAAAAPPTPASLHWPGARRTSPPTLAAAASAELGAPRVLRPRPRPALGAAAPSSPTSSASARRTRTVSDSAAPTVSAAYPSPPASSSSAASSTGRRRTFGGSPSSGAVGGTLAAVMEDERPETAELAMSTPMTRSRSGSDGEGTTVGEAGAGAESDRRLRRRRTVGGAADIVGGAASSLSSSLASSTAAAPRRKGLR